MLQSLKHAYDSFKYSINGNRRSFRLNLLYRRYHRRCRNLARDLVHTEADSDAAARFARDGYFVFNRALELPVAQRLKQEVDAAFSDPSQLIQIGENGCRLLDGIERFPEIMTAIRGRIEGMLRAFYGSEFKIFAAPIYRIIPSSAEADKSFLWHIDNCPREELKLMVYLDDCSIETGAFRLKPKPVSRKLLRDGFWNRHRIRKHESVLNDDSTTVVFEMEAGSAVLFMNSGCIHKATAPTREHRDVANFVIIPSTIPWLEHYSRNRHLLSTNAGICTDPYRDVPESISYRQ